MDQQGADNSHLCFCKCFTIVYRTAKIGTDEIYKELFILYFIFRHLFRHPGMKFLYHLNIPFFVYFFIYISI